MRSQEQAIFDSIAKGGLDVQVPFLSKAELMVIAGKASGYLGGDPSRLTRNSLEGWFRLGILKEPHRTKRNRLFSITDVFRVAAVFHLSTCGIRLDACRLAAEMLEDDWINANFERAAKVLTLETMTDFDVTNFLVLSTVKGEWEIAWFDTFDELSRQTKVSGGVFLLNAATLFSFCVSLSHAQWDAKAKKLLLKYDAMLEKRRLRKPSGEAN